MMAATAVAASRKKTTTISTPGQITIIYWYEMER